MAVVLQSVNFELSASGWKRREEEMEETATS